MVTMVALGRTLTDVVGTSTMVVADGQTLIAPTLLAPTMATLATTLTRRPIPTDVALATPTLIADGLTLTALTHALRNLLNPHAAPTQAALAQVAASVAAALAVVALAEADAALAVEASAVVAAVDAEDRINGKQ